MPRAASHPRPPLHTPRVTRRRGRASPVVQQYTSKRGHGDISIGRGGAQHTATYDDTEQLANNNWIIIMCAHHDFRQEQSCKLDRVKGRNETMALDSTNLQNKETKEEGESAYLVLVEDYDIVLGSCDGRVPVHV